VRKRIVVITPSVPYTGSRDIATSRADERHREIASYRSLSRKTILSLLHDYQLRKEPFAARLQAPYGPNRNTASLSVKRAFVRDMVNRPDILREDFE
jgi:hypothetical protein